MRRAAFVGLFGSMALACSGGGGGGVNFVDPDSVKFTYGTPGAPSVSEQDAAVAGEGGASDTVGLTGAADESRTESLVNLPDQMGNTVFGDTMSGTAQTMASARLAMSRRAGAFAAGDLVTATTGWDDPGCVALTDTSVTYNGCTLTESDTSGTMKLTVNGFLRRGLTTVEWDATADVAIVMYDTGGNLTAHTSSHLVGSMGVTEVSTDLWNIAGSAKSDNSASASYQGQSVSYAFTHNLDMDLDYQPSISCVVGGNIELKRIWTQRPAGYGPADLPNVGVLFQWTGCESVQVSWGTLQ